ncbi:MAG: BMC domain-containing protein [Acidobacteria bacterium]|nr:BMC domain-containing protein [Acidobacteriota bacterium]
MPPTPPAAAIPTLGVVELSSVPKGILVCDAMLKKARVRLLRAEPLGSGKFLILVTGLEADLEEALAAARAAGDPFIIGWTFIPRIHPQVVEALFRKGRLAGSLDAVGVVELHSLAGLIQAADAALKTAAVRLIELTFDLDLGGKGFFTLTGPLHEVSAAVEAAERQLGEGSYLQREIIPRPHASLSSVLGDD